MLVNLTPINSQLRRLQEIPATFFQNLEAAVAFDNTLFPNWIDTAFGPTDLKAKFRLIYNKYKAIADPLERAKVINAFVHNNQIENLCANQPGILCIPLNELHADIRNEIDNAFHYLYQSAINYHGFTTYVADNVDDAIDRFIAANKIYVCPFCGLEGYTNLDGQSRIALDHWLCKDIFPVASVNFANLIPIGEKCNGRPAKGATNILLDNTGARVRAFYPFLNHHSVSTTFSYINEPSILGITDADWNLTITPTDNTEQYLYESWNSIFNILSRYKDFFRKVIFPSWESEYKTYIEDAGIGHANSVAELRQKFQLWRAAFPLNSRTGARAYRAFIDYLINHASEAYLYSLCENFRR